MRRQSRNKAVATRGFGVMQVVSTKNVCCILSADLRAVTLFLDTSISSPFCQQFSS